MKNLWMMVVVAGSLLMAGSAAAGTPEKVQTAVEAAKQWLDLVDTGRWGESWDTAAPVFKNAAGRDQWIAMLERARGPLGDVLHRKVQTANYLTALPGAPAGEYVVIQFQVTFSDGKSMVETITPMLDTDNIWKVSGYYIK
ncbi:MAG: DUF4019 domain-containing protein [Candidatus Omnitrophota bacterium]|nr:DUF4019 domain-containing protein [Candidatus Omnitrophota bacterium]MDZ4242263.1 DUF4019 domain-containing protein [Candidatus Omnitrophota bacterium]